MANQINRENWLIEKVEEDKKPIYQCPSCKRGVLMFKENWATKRPTAVTQKQTSLFISQFPEENKTQFIGFLSCSNNSCNENVAVIGKAGYAYEWDYNRSQNVAIEVFEPRYFYPSLNIFSVSELCPIKIRSQIEKSFSHYFNDASACANSIRTAIELVMDEQGVLNNTTKFVALGARIKEFQKKNKAIGDLIEAVKWIGNAGSHESGLQKLDLLDGYELLQFIIDELYVKKERFKKLSEKAALINSSKKPINK